MASAYSMASEAADTPPPDGRNPCAIGSGARSVRQAAPDLLGIGSGI